MVKKSRKLKRIAAWLIILCFAISNFCLYANADNIVTHFDTTYYSKFAGKNISLNVFNWGLYISDGSDESYNVVKEFENLTGIKVNYSFYATNEELYAKLKSGGASYDVIIPSEYMVSRLIEEDMLEKINFSNIPNMENTMPEFFNPGYDPTGEYSVPYTWGTVVLIYNQKYVTETVDSWDILWNEKYKGKMAMFQNSRDSMAIALKKLGYSMNTTDESELERAAEELTAQRPLVQYYMDEIFSKLGSNEIYIAPYYAGDAVNMIADNPDLMAIYPKEGTNRFVDAACIPKGAANKEAAEMFINFLCEPVVAAANAEFTEYCTPNIYALELLDDEIKNNPITYPEQEILDNTEMFINLPASTNAKIDTLWTTILGASSMRSGVLIAVAVLFVAAVAVLIIRKNKKRNLHNQHQIQ